MIVECTECQTRFQLDDARVPASGIRVRCSRCKHAFFLKPPGAGSEDAIHEAAAEAAAAEAVPPPGSTQDLDTAHVEARSSEAEEDDAGDWEFNQEVPDEPEDDGVDAGLAADDDESIGVEGIDEDPGQTLGEDEPQSDFGEGDLEHDALAAGGTEPVVDPVDLDLDSAPKASAAVGDLASGSDLSAFGGVEDMDQLDAARSAKDREAADDSEDWDFFGDAAGPSSAAIDSAFSAASAAIDESIVQDPMASGEPTGLDALSEPVRRKNPLAPWLGAAGNAIGWAVVIGLFGLGLVRGLRPGFAPEVAVTSAVPVEGLRAEDVEAHWVDSARAGRLLVVSGALRGDATGPPVPVGALEVALLGAGGRVLDHPGQPLGVPLAETILREAGPRALLASRNGAGAQLASVRVDPSTRVPFQAILMNVPLEAQRFDIRRPGAPGSAPADSGEASSVAGDAGAAEETGASPGPVASTTGTPPR